MIVGEVEGAQVAAARHVDRTQTRLGEEDGSQGGALRQVEMELFVKCIAPDMGVDQFGIVGQVD